MPVHFISKLVAAAGLLTLLSPTVPSGAATGPLPTVDAAAFAGEGELAFISQSRLWVLDGNATLHQLPAIPGFSPASPELSPDGHWLAYLEAQTNPATGLPTNQLWVARADGADAHRLAASVEALYGWEPRHDVLAVSIGGVTVGNTAGIDLVTPSGATRRLVSFPTKAALASQVWVEGATWSSDGSALAVSLDDHVFSHGGTTALVAYPVGGGQPTTWLSLPGDKETLLGMRDVLAYPAGWWERWGIAIWVIGDGATRDLDQTPLAVIARPGAAVRVIGSTLSTDPDEALAAGPSGQLAIVDNPYNLAGRLVSENKVLEVCKSMTRTCFPVVPSRTTVSSEPAWSPDGQLLAFVEAPASELIGQLGQSGVAAWYAKHRLFIYSLATRSVRELSQAPGATVPTWSASASSILYVSADDLWLLRTLATKPVRIAGPLFPPGNWDNYFAEVDWTGQFSWWS